MESCQLTSVGAKPAPTHEERGRHDDFGLLVTTLGNKLASATWPLLDESSLRDVAKDGPKTLAVTMVNTDHSWEHFEKNSVMSNHSDNYMYFLTLNFPFFFVSNQI